MNNSLERLITPFTCAVLLTLANAFKPLVIDDSAYVLLARHIGENPTQPYGPRPRGFTLIWYQEAQGAFTLLAPPVIPYWLALEQRIFGEQPILWKVGLFPFCWVFTAGVFSLLKRFATGLERPLLLMTVVSPTFLPSVNLMLDVPAVGLAIAAIALFLRALDQPRRAWPLILAAGLLAGVAMQTKYTAATAPAVMLWYAILRRRLGSGLVVCGIATAVFAAWEIYIAQIYGQSHFLFHSARRYGQPPPEPPEHDALPLIAEPYPLNLRLEDRMRLAGPLFGYLGGLGPAVALLAWFALRTPRFLIRAGVAFMVIGFAALALIPSEWAVFLRSETGQERVSVNSIVVGTSGFLFLSGALAICAYLGFRGWRRMSLRLRAAPAAWFLIGFFGTELAAYFALSPFGAARRVMGLMIATTLLTGYLFIRTRRRPRDRITLWRLTLFGVFLGVLYWAVDFVDAHAEKRAAADCAQWIRQRSEMEPTVWYCGHWGFQYYAERQNMRPVFPGRSVLNEGDWFVYPDPDLRPHQQVIRIDRNALEPVLIAEWLEPMPVRTISDYYAGASPIRRHEGARMRVTIYRVRTTVKSQSP